MSRVYRIKPDTTIEAFTEALLIEKRYCCLIKGPFGSGKSVACIHAAYLLTLTQPLIDGRRRSKWAFVRNTKPQLKETTLRTFLDWFPEGGPGHMHWTDMRYVWDDGVVYMEILFLPLDTPDDVGKLLSLELTGCLINEAREIDKQIWEGVDGRVGRYPSRSELNPHLEWLDEPPNKPGRYYKRHRSDSDIPWELVYVRGGRKDIPLTSNIPLDPHPDHQWAVAPWYGVIADSNPSDDEAYMAKLFEGEASVPDSSAYWKYSLFSQPPGLIQDTSVASSTPKWKTNPNAENVENLPAGYYESLAVGKNINYIRMYCLGQNAVSVDGKPVYTQFDDNWHVADFSFDPNLPVYVGWDFGVNGQACILAQLSKRGQLRVFDEFVGPTGGLGFWQFCRDIVKPGLAKYKGAQFEFSWCDPAGAKRADTDEKSSLGILNDEYDDLKVGLPFVTYPCDTNALQPRIDAVNFFLANNVPKLTIDDAVAPRFLLHPRCKTLRRGFNGKYHYRRVQVSEERYMEIPHKNDASHPHDCLHYVARGIISHFMLGQSDQQEQAPVRKPRRGNMSGY